MFPINYWCAVPESSHKCWKTIKCVLLLLRPRQWSQQVTVTVVGLTDGRYCCSPEISDSWTQIPWTSPSHTRDTALDPAPGAHTPFSEFWLDSYQHNTSRTFSQLSTVEVERDADASNKLQIPNISRCHVALSGHNGKMYQFHRSRPPVLAAAVPHHHHRVMMALGNYCCLQLVKDLTDCDWTLNKAATGNSTQFRNGLMC